MSQITIISDTVIDEDGKPYFEHLNGACIASADAKGKPTHIITAMGGPFALSGEHFKDKPYLYAMVGGPNVPFHEGAVVNVNLDSDVNDTKWPNGKPRSIVPTRAFANPTAAGVRVLVKLAP